MAKCICGKQFKTYNGLRSHTYTCQITNNSTNEKTIRDTPSLNDIWKIVRNLVQENSKLKEEVKQLKSSVRYQQRKIPIMQLLRENSNPKKSYEEWLPSINVNQTILDIVFKDGQTDGIIASLKNSIERLDERDMFIRAFTHKPQTLYIYKNKEWCVMDTETISELQRNITTKLIIQFREWEKDPKVQKLLQNYDTQDIYLNNFEKTLGSKTSPTKAASKIKNALYTYLKCDPIKFVSF